MDNRLTSPSMGPGMGNVEVKGLRIAYRRVGSGPVLLLVHPGSRLVVTPGVGHAANMEAPERFNAEVRGFLRSLP